MLLVYPNIHFIELSRSDIYFERNISGIFNAKNGYRPQKIRVFGRAVGAVLYLTGINPSDNSIHRAKPCPLCARSIIQAGIEKVVLRTGDGPDNYVAVKAGELAWVQEP